MELILTCSTLNFRKAFDDSALLDDGSWLFRFSFFNRNFFLFWVLFGNFLIGVLFVV